MSSDQSFRERQENELLSISSIYFNEVKDLRKHAGMLKWKPLEMIITVFPEESMTADKNNDLKVDLYIRCSENYPKSCPFIDIRNSKGISNENLSKLKDELIDKAKELVGGEVILELVCHSRAFLYNHKKPRYPSFFEEMLSNNTKKQLEEAEKLEKENIELKQKQQQILLAIEQEKLRKMEALRDANKRTRFADEPSAMHLNIAAAEMRTRKESMSRKRSRSTSIGKELCTEIELQDECKEMLNSKLKFMGKKEFTIVCGRCLNHNDRGCVTYGGMDSATGNLTAVIKWTLQFNVNHKLKGEEWEALQKEQAVYRKNLESIEQEFKAFRQIESKHLVHYLGINCIFKKEKITIYILQEFIAGSTLSYMCETLHLTMPQIQHYTREILEALKCLHDNSIVHKNLRASSLFVDRNGIIRMTDYSLDKRLYDLYRSLANVEEINIYPPTIGKGGKKGDIYRLGVLLISFIDPSAKGAHVTVPEDLNPTFKDFLQKCLLHDEQERWSAEQLLSHPFLAHVSTIGMLPKEDDNDDTLEDSLGDDAIQGSRLCKEFDILKKLGKGGFGHVWKVKNKLDSRVYALKKIPLDSSNKQLNRKIKREVKLLSRLNHENIVRYYHSWIEAACTPEHVVQNGTNHEISKSEKNTVETTESSVQWKIHDKDLSSSDDDDNDDDDKDDDSFIVFMTESAKDDEPHVNKVSPPANESSSIDQETLNSERDSPQNKVRQFMYIQMEFCEKSTLRTAIDNGLHKDISLMWRFFREIVEGLHYMHQQGVIHRDLKPVNIFLDSNDHVKIGDFGLATNVISKSAVNDVSSVDVDSQSRSEVGDGTQTGRVGTTFYVAPELATCGKVSYSQKVDIYSLGIIFFEMCYPPPVTLMERNLIISDLRQRDIKLPEKAHEVLTDEMIQLIKWLLQHDVTKRPNSNELITSKYIPPLLMEESELNNLLQTTVSNPQSRMYKHMISALFAQKVTPEFDFTYDIDVFRSQGCRCKPSQTFSNVVDVLNKIMKLHAAVYLSVPTLVPKSLVIDNESCVQIMEHGGGIVTLPHNLRVPFARYIAQREIDHLKRYSLEKVYRQQKVFGCHPREQYEFAFDIVTPTPNSFLPDAEIIAAVSEIISEFPSLESRNYCIRLNHASLLKAILMFSEIEEEIEAELYEIAGMQKDKCISKAMLINEDHNLNLSQRSLSRLCQFIELEESINKINNSLNPVMQKKGKACILAKNSLKELTNILSLTEALGVKLPILICPGLAQNINLFSGMFFQCICSLNTSKKKNVFNILAVGGRYDKMIQSFKLKSLPEVGKTINQSAVGASIAIENIIASENDFSESQKLGIADFLIHSEGPGMSLEKATLMKELQDFGVRATVLYDKNLTLDDAEDFCRNQNIQHILILRKEEPGILKIRSVEREKVSEKRIIYSELKDLLPKICSKPLPEFKMDYSRSQSVTNSLSVNVRFLASDKTHSNKKREQNIRTHVISTLQISSSRIWELIPLELKMVVINTIVSFCDISANVDAIQRSFDNIIDEFSKHKKYLSQLCEEICDIRSKKSNSAIILYSLLDNNFKILL
ncbi:eIF-2-alpha kinase GCN2 [Nephila pilipes]|uniref:non-specific serine/threonine protein kinase n=1 Tax=Nephila pilipes TaxID=299642 RepID=A0A8X6N674_NEPPI|nr:eIF-2-alpha kinase GCN2 [Nephila pilipes]